MTRLEDKIGQDRANSERERVREKISASAIAAGLHSHPLSHSLFLLTQH
jgi:hypothetical protein